MSGLDDLSATLAADRAFPAAVAWTTAHAMFPVVPKTETRFWAIFRCLLLPTGAISLLLCIVMAIVTALGESAPVIDGREVRGLAGVLICLAAFPFVMLFGAFGFTVALYFDRMKMRRRR